VPVAGYDDISSVGTVALSNNPCGWLGVALEFAGDGGWGTLEDSGDIPDPMTFPFKNGK